MSNFSSNECLKKEMEIIRAVLLGQMASTKLHYRETGIDSMTYPIDNAEIHIPISSKSIYSQLQIE